MKDIPEQLSLAKHRTSATHTAKQFQKRAVGKTQTDNDGPEESHEKLLEQWKTTNAI